MDRWRGRVVIVTGASSGIGEGIARLLVEEGLRVVAVARRLDRLQALAEELRKAGAKGEVHAVQGDVTKEEDVKRVVKWARDNLGGADVLVNNAGVSYYMSLDDIVTDHFKKTFDTNVLGLSMFTREVIKDMRERKVDDGHIFHIGSIMGVAILDAPKSYVYHASKHAVRVLTEGLRRELRDAGTKIRITEISPGIVRSEVRVASGRLTAEEAKKYYDNNPTLEPRDIADALLYSLGTPPHVQVHEIVIQPVGQL